MPAASFRPCGSRVCALKISSYNDRNLRGTLHNPNLEQDVEFNSLIELLLLMESLFDDIGSPQRTMKPRGNPEQPELRPPQQTEAPLATFIVDVMFRQNASWQGDLVWQETRQETPFRSVLELVTLMDEALKSKEDRKTA